MRKIELPVDTLIRDYNGGMSCIALAHKYRISKRTVLRRLKVAQVVMRSLSDACRRFSLDTGFFSSIDTEEKAYWLGFLLADGNIQGNGRFNRGRGLRIALQRRDEPHLVKLQKALHSNHRLKRDDRLGCTWLCISSRPLTQPLEISGWHEFKRRGDLRIVQVVPSSLICHLLRGLIDGDGWVCHHQEDKTKPHKKWILGFTDLHRSVVEWVAQQFSIASCPSKARVRQGKGHRNWTISYSGNNMVPPMLRWLYHNCTVALDRKFNLASQSFH